MVVIVRTEKQAAILKALGERPEATDAAIAKRSGASRGLVRRVRERLRSAGGAPIAETPPERSVPWPRALDPVFQEGGFADELEGFVEELVRFGGRLDRKLSEIEVQARGHHVRDDRHRLVRQVYQLARDLQASLVPVGPCPFCQAQGCSRCTGGGWAEPRVVDAGALLEQINARSRWWRIPRVQVPL